MPGRLEAYRHHHDAKSAPFYLLTTPLDLHAQLGSTHPGAVFIVRSDFV
jgi:hypothetical protein